MNNAVFPDKIVSLFLPAIQPRLGKTLINSLNLVEDFARGCRNDFNPLPLVSLKSKTKGLICSL